MTEDAQHSWPSIPPVRGLIPLHNHKGRPYNLTDIHRWMRLNRVVYKNEKVDLLQSGRLPSSMPDLVYSGRTRDVGVSLELNVSLRTDCTAPPENLRRLKEVGLYDVFLCPRSVEDALLPAWFEACAAEGLPVRLQVQPPFPTGFNAAAAAQRFVDAGVVAFNVVFSDPFMPSFSCQDAKQSQATVDVMNDLVAAVDALGVEANLYGLPLCMTRPENQCRAGNSRRFFLDHQQYHMHSYELATTLYQRSPALAGLAVSAYLGRYTFFRNPVDDYLLEWLVEKKRRWHAGALLLRKLTRRFRLLPGTPKSLENRQEVYEQAVEERRAKRAGALGPICSQCSLQRICDHETPEFRRRLPGLFIAAQPGEVCPSPLTHAHEQRKHYDSVDQLRHEMSEQQQALTRKANDIIANYPPDREFGFHEYLAENTYHIRMPGAVRWYSLTDREVLSTVLHWGKAPLTVAVTFGGGIADYVGFSLGRGIKLVCPMVAYSHRVVLHVEADGQFVLVRDGEAVRPSEFEGMYYVPTRLPSDLQLRFSMWNIDDCVCTQNLLIWEGVKETAAQRAQIKYSVVVVSTRYTRRLQAALRSIAHQEGIDLAAVEVIVGYVPGIDATDDLLTSIQLTYPQLRVVRATFSDQNINAKGFIINESLKLASGKWIIFLDADILLAPTWLKAMEVLAPTCRFVAPAGRKMLTRETTAQVLLGEIEPWRAWQALLDGPGEGRYGDKREGGHLPVGFCQCVRAECLKTVQYHEYDHFEGADWEFAIEMDKHFGACTWLDLPVLHLDHGGSQWYGAKSHL